MNHANTKRAPSMPAALTTLVKQAAVVTREQLENAGHFNSVAIVCNLQAHFVYAVPFDTTDLMTGQLSIAAVQHIADAVDADAIVMLLDAWVVKHQNGDYAYTPHQYSSLAKHPDAVRAVLFTVETRSDYWEAITPQFPLPGCATGHTMGRSLVFRFVETAEGRFTSVLSGHR